ncbi:hypothetical protein GLYMA_07G064802v4 [Glycine max]|nr:hypothetical protein GLYMA_07G064802v4 [Glycine max]
MLLLEVATCIIIYILVLLPIAAASDGGLRRRPPAATSPASFVRSPMSPSTSSARIFNRSPSASTFFTSSVCGNGWSTLRKGRSTLAPFASRVAGPATLAGSIFSQWEMRTIV